jgi:hypothetical protein
MRRTRGPGLVALSALLAVGCLPKYFRQVPPSFVFVENPVEKVEPSPTAATVVIYDGAIDTLAPNQPFTLVLEDGTALGQAPPKTWLSFQLPPGDHTIAGGVPEIADVRPSCAVQTWTLEAGKIYVLLRSLHAVSPEDNPAQMISLMSRLRVDQPSGQARVSAQWHDYWAPCIAKAKEDVRLQQASLATLPIGPYRDLILAALRVPPPFTELVIPSPP